MFFSRKTMLALRTKLVSRKMFQRKLREVATSHRLRPRFELLEDRRVLATFVVTTTSDSGAGSLRDAIISANSTAGADVINFNIGGGGAQTIAPLSAYPTITEAVQIQGDTQPGWAGTPLIEIRGDSVVTGNPTSLKTGLTLGASSIVVQQLAVNRFVNEGIWIAAPNVSVLQNYVGTDIGGTVDLGNNGNGIYTAPGATGSRIIDNLVSGNDATGVLIQSNSNFVQGNKIGTDFAGTSDLGNSLAGVWIYLGSSNFVGVDGDGFGDSTEGNLISGNDSYGVYFADNSDNNVVAGNLIGTDAAGTGAIGNTSGGIAFLSDFQGDNNRIGTDSNGISDDLERNIVSGNLNYGIIDYGIATKIAGNYVGTKIDGLSALPNSQGGVTLGSSGAIVGGTNVVSRNVISGNAGFGVSVSSAAGTGNTILGNYIGVDVSGDLPLPNTTNGVQIQSGASNNTIGGTTAAARNIISGNTSSGVSITDVGSSANKVFGNYIGIGADGSTDVGNDNGVLIQNGATGNFIGSGVAGAGNVIAGNAIDIALQADQNKVQSNRISVNAGETAALVPSFGYGVYVDSGAARNIIGTDSDGTTDSTEGNIIGYASTAGIFLQNNLGAPDRTVIAGNRFGLASNGTTLLNSGGVRGIWLSGATNTRIGSDADGNNDDNEVNVIVNSVNSSSILVTDGTVNTTIAGNYLGTNATGSDGLATGGSGIVVQSTATPVTNTVIGGTSDAARNVISSMTYGIVVSGAGTAGTTIIGNNIGTDKNGTAPIGNVVGVSIESGATGITVGGTVSGAGNVISGNQTGLGIDDSNANTVLGNYIGLASDGLTQLANTEDGVYLTGTSASNTIGSTISTGANYISGNTRYGIATIASGTGNKILGNVIGLNTADQIRANGIAGILNSGGAGITIGGTSAGSRNIISGNDGPGVWLLSTANNTVQGNYIGTNSTGDAARGNADGIFVDTGSSNNTFGGATPGARNVISGNGVGGVLFINSGTNNNSVVGNYIGTDRTGTLALGNALGIRISSGASNNIIGGSVAGAGNVISGNTQFGVVIGDVGTANNTILGNRIGTNSAGTLAVPNRIGVFVEVGAANTTIGGPAVGAGNLISGNAESGIGQNVSTTGTVVQGNFIGTDVTGTTGLDNGGDGILAAGPIQIGGLTTVAGTGPGNVISSNGSSPTNGGGNIRVGGSGVVVQGNIIGLDKTGGNVIRQATQYGVWSLDSNAITIGGATTTARNIISGNELGILLQGGSGHLIQNNYVGTDITGSLDKGNSIYGITTDASNTVFRGNVISGNDSVGLSVSGSFPVPTNVQIVGNTIGLNAAGTAKLGNVLGIDINSANQITIGGTTLADRNLVGGNSSTGVTIRGGIATTNVVVQGNYIGVDKNGTTALGNGADGIYSDAYITIGGLTNTPGAGAGNLISGNGGSEGNVRLFSGGLVQGNIMGLDSSGTNALDTAGADYGIWSFGGSNLTLGGSNTQARNIISGNEFWGVLIQDGSNHIVSGNYIGTDITGSLNRGNGLYGVEIDAANSLIGGTTLAERNVISGNFAAGISMSGNSVTGNQFNVVSGNYIGTNVAGTSAIPNGIGITIGSAKNTIGGTSILARNVISGNTGYGVTTSGNVAINNVIQNNYIGTDWTGEFSVGNSTGASIQDGANTLRDNLISGNSGSGGDGVYISGPAAGSIVAGNIIGLNKSGSITLSNAGQGISISGSSGITIGGNNSLDRNVIGGNVGNGVLITSGGGNAVYGNYIGTDATGLLPRGNDGAGIEIIDSPNAKIGGGAIGQGNVIGANHVSVAGASSGTRIQGNIIGADRTGTVPLSNEYNVALDASSGVIIGTDSDGSNDETEGNVIAITSTAGVAVFGSFGIADGNVIAGNLIGTTKSGDALLTSFAGRGVWIASATNTRIGGLSAIERNVINSSGGDGGILLTDIYDTGTTGTVVQGNYVGLTTNGSTILSTNNGLGIHLTTDVGQNVSNNTIGGTVPGAANVIGGWATGITLASVGVKNNSIAGNFIGNSSVEAISLSNGAANNSISGNSIGINSTGNAIPNAIGIHVLATSGINPISDNQIRYSTSDNILVEAPSTVLRRNVSADMGGMPIRLNPSTLSPGTITVTQVVSGANPLVLGEVRAKPSTLYTIDLFSSPIAGQASNYITSSTVTTDATGFAPFSIASTAGKLNGYVSATLTGLGASGNTSTSSLSAGILATPTIILGLLSQSPEGTPITLTAFSSSNPVTGYLWQVNKDGSPYTYELRNDGTQSEGGIQFTPDNQGLYTVSLRVTLNDGSQFLLGPFAIDVYNVAPTPSFEYGPSSPVALSPITLTSNNSDPGKIDVLKTSWVVRTGSATGPIVYSTTPSTATTTSFTPAGGDLYYVTMTVDDGDGGVRTLTRVIEVAGLPVTADIVVPQPTAVEGQKVRARASESLLNRTETISFVWTLTKTPVGAGAVPAAYPFTVPSPGVIEFLPNDDGVYTIGLTVFKAGTTTGGIVAPPQIVTVTNASPRVSIVRNPVDSGSSLATLNAPLSLTANIADPGTADTHTILWSVKRDNQVLPVTGTGTNFSYTPTVAGIYEISAQATDDDFATTNPIGRGIGSRAFTVNSTAVNVAIVPPAGVTTATTLNEGTGYTFTATVPTGVTAYSWKARTTEGVDVSQATTSSFTFIPPQGGRYQIELQVTLADGSVANAIYGPLTVDGLAPVISSLAVISPTTTPMYEGTAITMRTTAVDARDPIGLTYRWELQKPGEAAYSDVGAVDGSPIDLRFTPEDQGTYSVRVSVSDSQGLITTRVLAISVLNALPVARINSTYLASSPTQLTFSAIASDPGTADTLRYEWSVNGGAFIAPVASNQFVAPLAGLNNIRVRVTDKDGGSITTSYFVIQGTSGDDIYTITASDVAASGNADQILYLALDGNDNITIASTVTKKVIVLGGAGNDTINASAALVNVLLDGGDGDDILTGGIGDDVLIAGIGTNILVGGDGNNRFIGGGNDTMTGGKNADYYEVHFSTVVINDTTGGYDTIDLTAAQAGVSLNLSDNTGLAQTVFTGSTLALKGDFERLIGSTFNDTLSTNTSGTTIEGGIGDDTLSSSAANTTLDGGSGNDSILLNGAAGTFSGGGGNDTIAGTLGNSVATSIATGDGNDVVNVFGPSLSSPSSVSISVGGGINSVTASNVTGQIYGNNGSQSNAINAYGSASSSVSSIVVSNATSVGIYGTASLGSSINVTNSTSVGIYGTGSISLNSVSSGTITSTQYGSATLSSNPTLTTLTSSTNVGIYGSASSIGPSLSATVTNSTNVGIYGSARSGGSISVSGGGDVGIYGIGDGSVELNKVTSGVNRVEISNYGTASVSSSTVTVALNSSTNVGIYGSASSTGPTLNATLTNSTSVGIYGSATKAGLITVSGGSDVGIYGLVSGEVNLTNVVGATVKGTEYGSASTSTTSISIIANNSTNVGIYGSASTTGPSLSATVTNSTNVGIYGSASQSVSAVVVSNSTSVGIYGSASSTGSTLSATLTNSTSVGIYGSARTGDNITVVGGSDVGIYGLNGGDISLTSVLGAVVSSTDYGSATTTVLTVAAINSTSVGIYGSASTTGPSLSATITNSTNVGIYGSARSGNIITVSGGADVGIYSAYSDTITVSGAQRVTIQGGVYGTAQGNQGINVTVTSNATNVGIFGTELTDVVQVYNSSVIGLNLGGGDDQLIVDGAIQLVAITDAGVDRVSIRSGSDMLIYLGDGNDQAEVLGGSLIRIIGEAGDDQFSISGGDNIQLDGGNNNDQMYIFGGQSLYLRGDAGNDIADIYGGVGISLSGAAGNDRFRVFGSLGGPLDAGLVYAYLDGQDDDDTIEARPLYSVSARSPIPVTVGSPYTSIPSWITIPTWVSAPATTTYPSSIALVGGVGTDSLWLEGAERLYGLGGDGNDTITLQSGNNSEVSGGYGLDNITINAAGVDNRVFGDQDNDTIRANAGVRLGVFGEEGSDNIAFYGGVDSFARGGDAIDTMDIFAGTRVTLVGETGDDNLTIRGGTDGIAAGSSGDDTMEITGGTRGILLGQTGNDSLKATGGTLSIVSGGDGDDTITASNRGDELYGDDGDDVYQLLNASTGVLSQSQTLRLRELLYIDPKNFEPESRGSDTVDLSAFATGATLNLSTTGLYNSMTAGLQSVIAGQLQLILLGSLENIIGTPADDTLVGSLEANRLEGRGGNDSLSGLAGDDTLDGGTGNDNLNGGAGDDLYKFSTTAGVSLGSDTLYEATNGGVDALDFSGMPLGLGTIDLNLATVQLLASGLLNITLRQSPTNTARGDVEEIVGTPFDDTIFGNELDNRIEPGAGNDIVDGRSGSDIYVFSGRGLGSDQVVDASAGFGRDTLDFAAFVAPIQLDLALTTPQDLRELTLTLTANDSIENVVGTSYDDTILGNARDNTLYGAAGADRLEGRAGNDNLVADLPSIVLLDFDSAYRADRGDYNYSTAERNAIQAKLVSAYSAFNWKFTQYESVVPVNAPTGSRSAQDLSADMGRNYVRIAFSQGRGGGVSGDAGQVDFRNISRRLTTEVNINSLLPTVRDLVTQQVGVNYTAQDFSNMVVALTSTIAVHELAHTAGLRHGDSFGPIGTGLYSGTDISLIYPSYTGAAAASETGKHYMASPASVGTTIADAVGVTFFGERESIKLAFDEIGRTQREANAVAGSHGSIATAENLGNLAPLYVPNLAPPTGFIRSGQSFKVSALAVVGDLGTFSNSTTERDYYKFSAKAGEVVNIELLANSLRPLRGKGFDGELRLFKADGTQIAFNDDDFEGTKDPTLTDVLITSDGDYYISVGLSASPAIASDGGRYELFITRFIVGPSGAVVGDTLVGGTGNDTLTGGAADDLFLVDGALATETDIIDGRGGNDTLDKQGRVYNYTGTSLESIISTGANSAPTVMISGAVDGVAGSSTPFTFTATDTDSVDANGPFEFTINWGDGSSTVMTSALGQRSIIVNHTYATASATGTYNISASARDARQLAGPAATKDFAATGYVVIADPIRSGQTILVIVGTQGADTIVVRETRREELSIRIRDRESSLRIRGRVDGDVNRILVFALDGNDQVIIDDDVDVDAEIWGGRGNDYIEGGEGNDIIWGGAGDDVIFGGEGRDILIGGTGADNIVGDSQDDILIGGLTAYDDEFNQTAPSAFGSAQRLTLNAQRLAMEAILAEWTSNRSYTIRRNNILGTGTGTRLNGNNFLKVSDSTLLSNTVFDDGALDRMWGSCGTDWFFANLDGDNRSAVDRVMDGDANETRTDIDKWF